MRTILNMIRRTKTPKVAYIGKHGIYYARVRNAR